MSEYEDWLSHPVTQALRTDLREEIDRIKENFMDASRISSEVSVEYIGAQTVALLNEIDGLEWLERWISDSDTSR